VIGIATAGGTGTAPQPPAAGSSPIAAAPGKGGDTRGVPAPITANLRDANRVVDGSVGDRLASLKGVPVVVNQWASWCPNCRAEFPFFQHLSQRYRKQVAFLGLDSQDSKGDAEKFLKQYPVAYPSVYDQDASQAQSLGGGQGWPTTMFVDRRGQIAFVKQGGYTTEAQLDADIRQYLLGS
jgi:thiol-disulfide isomerase/thioredoxin